MAISRGEIDTRGFGRGSAVREYWLMRCQGFWAVRPDGRRLGQVKRVETEIEGTFLRLTGLRARSIPLSAVDSVWPGASLLIISNEQADEPSQNRSEPGAAERQPTWTDDTVPWWELVDGDAARANEHVKAAYPRPHPHRARLTLAARRIRTRALSLGRKEAFAKAFVAGATRLVAKGSNSARTLTRKAIFASGESIRVLDNARMTVQSAVLASSRRIRLRVARSLLRLAAAVAGTKEFAIAGRDSRFQADESDTEEIDLRSGSK